MLGRALMARPDLLLMDKPSLGLSPIMVRKIGDIITDINRRRETSILLVEQNAQLALSIADRGYVLEMGKIPLSGKCKDLLNSEQVKKPYLS
jgi:branched-chain amino acid transport system ATP-binding protein